LRRAIIEPAILAAIAWFLFTKPESAPGPSDSQKKEKVDATAAVTEAKKEVDVVVAAVVESPVTKQSNTAMMKLQQAMARLKKIEEDLQAAELDLQAYPVPEFLKATCKGGVVNIAITGNSGVGKSSWINAIRKLSPKSPGAALTGVTETTTEPQMYKFPGPAGIVRRMANVVGSVIRTVRGTENAEDAGLICIGDRVLLQNCGPELDGQVVEVLDSKGSGGWLVQLEKGEEITVLQRQVTGVLADCVIWDLPGVGTPKFPQATYLQNLGIRHFDMVVMMTASRFTEPELALVAELEKWRVPFFIVRNKVDADIEAELDEQGEAAAEALPREEVEKKTMASIKKYFKTDFGLDNVYCISTRRTKKDAFDFQKLERDMEVVLRRQRGAVDA